MMLANNFQFLKLFQRALAAERRLIAEASNIPEISFITLRFDSIT